MNGAASTPHRPIARWVAHAEASGTGAHRITGPVNDGAERTDARTLRLFRDEAWRRTSVVASRDGIPAARALALHHPVRDTTYIELDDQGRPLRVSREGAELVARMETEWDAPSADPDVLGTLAEESPDLRYFLLHRLDAETDPSPVLFHALPWAALDTVADNVLTMLGGASSVEPPATNCATGSPPR